MCLYFPNKMNGWINGLGRLSTLTKTNLYGKGHIVADNHSTTWTRETELAYAAGIIDGEGSISISKNDRLSCKFRLQVQVGQAIKGNCLLEFLRDKFGFGISTGYRKKTPNRQIIRIAFLHGPYASDFLELVRPYLIFKIKQADVAIEFQKIVDATPRGHRRGLRQTARNYWIAMKELNLKGFEFMSENPESFMPKKTVFSDLFSGIDDIPT